MVRFIDPLYSNTFIDSNILNEIAGEEEGAIREIVAAADQGEIVVLLPYSVCEEVARPSTPSYVKDVVKLFVYSIEVPLTDRERTSRRDFVEMNRGNAKPENIDADLLHVWESAKNGGGHFITRDKRLIARASGIAKLLQIEVIDPIAFLERLVEARKRSADFSSER